MYSNSRLKLYSTVLGIKNFTLLKSSTAKEYPVQLQLAEWQEHIANGSLVQQPVRRTKCDGNYINRLIFYCATGLPHWNVAIMSWKMKSAGRSNTPWPRRDNATLIQNTVCITCMQWLLSHASPEEILTVSLARDDSGMVYQPETQWSKC